jgi:transcriptional regulator with XRE-family HTH domain
VAQDDFGEWVREERIKRGMTQGELAQAMRVDQTLVSKVELGAKPSADFALALSGALKIDLAVALLKAGIEATFREPQAAYYNDVEETAHILRTEFPDEAERQTAITTINDLLRLMAKRNRDRKAGAAGPLTYTEPRKKPAPR